MARSGLKRLHRGQIILQAGAVLHHDALGLQPVAVRRRPFVPRAGGADIGHIRAAFDQQAGDQQFDAFIARQRDPPLDRVRRQRRLDRRTKGILRRGNPVRQQRHRLRQSPPASPSCRHGPPGR